MLLIRVHLFFGGNVVTKSLLRHILAVWFGQMIKSLWANLFVSKMEIIIALASSWWHEGWLSLGYSRSSGSGSFLLFCTWKSNKARGDWEMGRVGEAVDETGWREALVQLWAWDVTIQRYRLWWKRDGLCPQEGAWSGYFYLSFLLC